MGIVNKIKCVFKGRGAKSDACCDKEMRENKTEKQIDKTINDSFPASDPPSNY